MALADLTKRAVELALDEYDSLGADAFLQTYGFADAKRYWLVRSGKFYPSKAIAGVAHKYVSGNQLLPSASFTGGEDTVVKRLRELGFQIRAVGRNPDWTRDELILALDLYMTNPASPPRQQSIEVSTISNLLNEIHRKLGTPFQGPDLRNNNGVYLKMMNFRALDPAFTAEGKVGMSSGGKLEKQIWSEFAGRPEALREAAEAIRKKILAETDPETSANAEGSTSEETRLPSGRVWVTSFWGFNPEGDGYLGFTAEGDRTWFLRNWRRGDLVMVYATLGDEARPEERGRILGFLEIEPRTIRDVDRMSPAGRQWKIDNAVSDRWTFAVPVVRAWRTVESVDVREIAPTSLGRGANWQLISRRGVLLSRDESAAALSLQVRPVDVFGQASLPNEEKAKVYVPSRGFPMSFGKRAFETKDGEHFLYMLQLNADAAVVLGQSTQQTRGKIVVKVGLAKDPEARCAQHNACLPPAGKLRWKVSLRSLPISDGATALDAETSMKALFAKSHQSLGGEFFLCEEKTAGSLFLKAAARR